MHFAAGRALNARLIAGRSNYRASKVGPAARTSARERIFSPFLSRRLFEPTIALLFNVPYDPRLLTRNIGPRNLRVEYALLHALVFFFLIIVAESGYYSCYCTLCYCTGAWT